MIGEYTISDDGIVNTNGAIKLFSKKFNEDGFTELPIQFERITYYFQFEKSNITTLKGFPHTVDEGYCSINNCLFLTSLEFSPKCKWFYCHGCEKLESLDGLNCEEFFGNNLNLKRFGENFSAIYFEFTEFPTPTADEIMYLNNKKSLFKYISTMRRFIQLKPYFNTEQQAPWIKLIEDYFEHKDIFIAIKEFEELYQEPYLKHDETLNINNDDFDLRL